MITKISLKTLHAYFKNIGFHTTYFQNENLAYYNPENRGYVFIPIREGYSISSQELKKLLRESSAINSVENTLNEINNYLTNALESNA